MPTFLTSLIIATWIGAIALLSVQNAAPVTLRFLTFESVQIPLGLVITFGAALGMVGMALTLPSLQVNRSSTQREDFEE
jgi:uncharacterized integral membrane protein